MKGTSSSRHSARSMLLKTGILAAMSLVPVGSFQPGKKLTPMPVFAAPTSRTVLLAEKRDGGEVQEYKNALTSVLSNFMQDSDMESNTAEKTAAALDPLQDINFDAPKIPKVELETLAAMLDAELYEKEWFVTGRVNPSYFADNFRFEDPDVKVDGIEDYAKGVYKLFDQETSRAEIISSVVNDTVPNTITVTWRLSGRVKVGPGLPIKPYICYTDFTVDEESGLIIFQEDRFDIPGWDILLSSLFPFLIGKITGPPAPPVEPRPIPLMPKESGANVFMQFFNKD